MNRIQHIAKDVHANIVLQIHIWQRLLNLSEVQAQALKNQDVHSVHAVLQEIELTLLERSKAEHQRLVLIEYVALELGMEIAQVTREIITAYCDDTLAKEIIDAAETLKSLIQELRFSVERNTSLLKQELEIIDVLVRGATEDRTTVSTYVKTGTRSEVPRLCILDAQV